MFNAPSDSTGVGIALPPAILVATILAVIAAQVFYLDRVRIRTGRGEQ